MTEIKYITIPVRVSSDLDEEVVKALTEEINFLVDNSPMYHEVVWNAVRRRPPIQVESKLL